MTYSSYLLHFPVQLLMALGFAIAGRALPFYSGAFFVVNVGATLLASYFAYRWSEAPAQGLLRKRLLPDTALPPRTKAADVTSPPRREPAAAGMP